MSERPDLRELVGEDVEGPELERLSAADEALRAADPPPEVPDSLTARVLEIPAGEPSVVRLPRRKLMAGLALAAAFAAATFGLGLWAGESNGPPVAEQVTLTATANGPAAARMVLDILPVDASGNWRMHADASGLRPLPKGGYYQIWLTNDDGDDVVSCGRFAVGQDGKVENVWLNAPYRFGEYDRWVVNAHVPGKPDSRWLLDGPVVVPT